jgi:putative transposase
MPLRAADLDLQAPQWSPNALVADGKAHLLEDEQLLDELHAGIVPDNDERIPVLLALSDNGPQIPSRATAVFMAGARIAQHFGRPSTPNDQAWVELFFGHLKGEFQHLDKIKDAGELDRALLRCPIASDWP